MDEKAHFHKRKEDLKRALTKILREKPDGIRKEDVWNVVRKDVKKGLYMHASFYGVTKMNRLLEEFNDVLCEVSKGGKQYIQLRKSESESGNIQSNQISSTRLSGSKTARPNHGAGLMPTPQTHPGGSILGIPPHSFTGAAVQIPPMMFSSSNFAPVGPAQLSAQFLNSAQRALGDPWGQAKFKQEDVENVSSGDPSDDSDEDFPSLNSPRHKESKTDDSGPKLSLNQLKQNLVEMLKDFPNGIKRCEVWNKYKNKYGYCPTAKEFGVNRLTNVLTKFTDVIQEFVKASKPYIRLTGQQSFTVTPPQAVPWGQGAVIPSAQRSNLGNRSLSSSTSSLDSHSNVAMGSPVIDWGGPSTSNQVMFGRPGGAATKVIDLTKEDGPDSLNQSKQNSKYNLIDLTQEKRGMEFISLDIAPRNPPGKQELPMQYRQQSHVMGQPGMPMQYQQQGPAMGQPGMPMQYQQQGHVMNPTANLPFNQQVMDPYLEGMNRVADLSKPMKPVSTKMFEQKEIRVTPVRYHGRFPNKEQLENVAKDCIEILSEADEHVSPDRVEKLILQRFQARYLGDLGIRYLDNISCVNEHNRMMSKVNAYIHAFVKVRSVCTLFELSECLKEFAPSKDNFANLKLGPLQRLPVVYQLFKFPPDYAEIPDITTMDVLEHLRNYMTKFQKWTQRIEMEEFMEYLVEEYDAENAYVLGVRLRSLPLCAQVLKKAQRDAGQTRKTVVDGFKYEVKRDVNGAFHKFRASILQTDSDGEMEVRRHYLKLNPVVVINEIFQKFQLLMSIDPPTGRVPRKKHQKFQSVINEFMTMTRDDSFGRELFHLAICISNTVLEEAALELLAPSVPEEGQGQVQGQQQEEKKPPSKDKVIMDLKKYMERCIAHGSLTLALIDKIEEKLAEDYGFPTFSAMGFGRFLQFLINEAKQMLEECGGTNIGSGTGSHEGDSGYKTHQTDVLEFIHQCKQCGATQPSQVESAVCKQFCVKEVKNLGYGNLSRLMTAADKPGKHQNKEHCVIYENVLSSSLSSSSQTSMQIGILGHQTRDAALACLHNCPLLEDLGSWSQWSLVFEPEHGKLREFIQKYGGTHTSHIDGGKKLLTTDVIALEVKPGQLLKLTNQTSPDKFEEALITRDVAAACGHLMSLVLINKGVEHTPLALLANHMKSRLFSMHANESMDNVPGAPQSLDHGPDKAVQFVLDCLVKLPLRSCVSLANQIFLDPLGHVVGSTKSKSLLFGACLTIQEQNRLQELGCLLGISEWTKQIHLKCQLPVSAIEEVPEDDAEEFFADGVQSEESEEESESETSSISSILSDDDDNEEYIVVDDADKDDAGNDEVEMTVESEDQQKETTAETEIENIEDERESGQVVDDKGDKQEVEEVKDENEAEEEPMTEEERQHRVCVAIVNSIRRDEFGIGIELNEDGQRLMLVQQERLGRSLDRLSKDLYSKDTHFVLELVQNADDNSYPEELCDVDSEDCPSVKFSMRNDAVLVLNNENGFTEKNIRALCDVGRSTKGKHKFGYIGQKGIGFKSVFRVTDRPEIHSSGYSICFDVSSGPMGYILPHWIDEDTWDVGREIWTTKIILPLKAEMQAAHTRSLAARFNDIHPSLLLFLHRLRQITIENQVENSVQTMKRRDYGKNLVEITHNEGTDQWLVIKKMLDASKISLQAKSGVDVESTEIALAFPLPPKGHRVTAQVLPPKQPVFAFLPLRSYGFRFIIQGDFDVPSSREDVDKDSPWNQWIRNEIHTLFIEALEVFKNHEGFNSMEAVTSFLQFVPLEDEILDFFRPVSHQILQKLKAKPCVPTQPNSRGMMSWRIPSQTIITRDPLTREVVTPELLQKHLNLFYLHRDVAEALNPTLTQSLGIESLTSEHLLQIGRALMNEWTENEVSLDQLHMIAKWLACVYRSIDEFQDNEDLFTKLKSMKTIPLATSRCISVAESTVFFPLMAEDTAEVKPAYSFKGRDPMSILHQDLNTIHPALVDTPDNEVNSQVQKLLLKMGVKQLSPHDVINHHILPILKSETWQNKSRETLISYVIYLKEQNERQNVSINMEDLQAIIQLATNKGLQNPKESSIHFTLLYGNRIDLPKVFPGYDWVLVDGVYLQQTNNQLERKQWHDFFSKLGVTDFLAIKKQRVEINSDNIKTTPWAPLAEMWGTIPDDSYIQDNSCTELHDLISSNSYPATHQEQMSALFGVLDREWNGHFSSFTMSKLFDGEDKFIKEVESSFSIWLKTLSWLPARQTEVTREANGSVSWTETLTLMLPSCLYRKLPLVEGYLSHTVMYLEAPVSQSSTFCDFLGVKTSVAIEEVKKKLIEWSTREKTDVPSIFCAKPTHIETIYKYLYENLPPKQLQELLHDNPVIFVPMGTNGVSYSPLNAGRYERPPEVIAGKMLSRTEVWWEDKTGLFKKYQETLDEYHAGIGKKQTLAQLYGRKGDITRMLLDGGRVDPEPSIAEYGELLILIGGLLQLSDKSVLCDTLRLYAVIGSKLSPPEGSHDEQTAKMILETNKKELMALIKKKKIIATKKQQWVGIDDHPMIVDSRELEKIFEVKEGVHFVNLEEVNRGRERMLKTRGRDASQYNMEDILKFIELCNVKKLSECVRTEEITEMFQPVPKLKYYMHQVVPLIQCYLYTHFPDIYQQQVDFNMVEYLKDLQFVQVSKLEVKYSLMNKPDIYVIQSEKCMFKGTEFYFHKDHVNSFPDINREIAKFFSNKEERCSRDLRSFLHEVSAELDNPHGDTNNVLDNHDVVASLPDTEALWVIEPPPLQQIMPEPEIQEEPEEIPEEPAAGNEEVKSNAGFSSSGLKAWPPMSDTRMDGGPPKKPGQEKKEEKSGSKVWPPPKAPDYFKQVRQLPSQVKVVSDATGDNESQQEGSTKGSGEGVGAGTGVGGAGGSAGGSAGAGTGSANFDASSDARYDKSKRKSSESMENPENKRTRAPGEEDHGEYSGSYHGDRRPGEMGSGHTDAINTDQNGHHTGMNQARSDGTGPHTGTGEPRRDNQDRGGDEGRFSGNVYDENGQLIERPAGEEGQSRSRGLSKRPREASESDSPPPVTPSKKPIHLDNPIWNEISSEYTYEELGSGHSLKIPPENVALDTASENLEIGRWGESVVYNFLLQEKENWDHIIDIVWRNEEREMGFPYDFEVHMATEEGITVTYIEVKSTMSDNKEVFEISYPQIQFAKEQKEYFHIYRVFNAGDSDKVRLVRIDNLSMRLDQKQVRLCMLI